MKYVILFTETPFMEGSFANIIEAYEAKEKLISRFPKLRLEIAEVSDTFKITHDMNWKNYEDILQKAYDEEYED